MINWAQTIRAPSASEILAQLMANARGLKFPTTSWGTKSVPRALMSLFSLTFAVLGGHIVDVAKSGFRTQAKGPWLNAHGEDFYALERDPAVFAIGVASLVNSSVDTYSYAAGALIAKSTVRGTDGHELLFTNVDAVSLGAGASQTLSWRAEHAGVAYNVGGETITELATPLPGVAISATPSSAWLTTVGVDEESDDAYSERQGQRWDTLGGDGAGLLEDAYAFHAKRATSQVTRCLVLETTPAEGHVTLVLGGPVGPVPGGAVTAVRAYLAAGRTPQCVTLHVDSAIAHLITLTGTVKVRAAYLAQAKSDIGAALAALQTDSDMGATIDVSNLVALARRASGVTHVTLATPAADIVLTSAEVATFADGLTYEEV